MNSSRGRLTDANAYALNPRKQHTPLYKTLKPERRRQKRSRRQKSSARGSRHGPSAESPEAQGLIDSNQGMACSHHDTGYHSLGVDEDEKELHSQCLDGDRCFGKFQKRDFPWEGQVDGTLRGSGRPTARAPWALSPRSLLFAFLFSQMRSLP